VELSARRCRIGELNVVGDQLTRRGGVATVHDLAVEAEDNRAGLFSVHDGLLCLRDAVSAT
jgi:hypothetical protein